MIKFKHKGNFVKLDRYFRKTMGIVKSTDINRFDKYGREGVAALASATPKDTGNTSKLWKYEIVSDDRSIKIIFHNLNIQKGVPIAIIIQYGHGTRNGGWVKGRDYINPAIQPIFDKITNDLWEEVTKA